MDIETCFKLTTQDTEEVITKEELKTLIETKQRPKAYWGFEASGLMHIGMGLVCGKKIQDLIEAGFDFTIFLADWHSWINNKLNGRMDAIRLCGEYFKQCFTAIGVDPAKTTYTWASELTARQEYWERVIRVAKSVNISRVSRALPIMGRELESKDIEAASTFYPCMQVADIFELEADVACAGMDQRKAHALARDVADKLGWRKPTSLHTHLIIGLAGAKKMDTAKYDENAQLNTQISSKMSKSTPEGSILIHDDPNTIRMKIRGAYCLPKDTENNSIVDMVHYISFPWQHSINIERPEKYGGSTTYDTFEALEADYREGRIHPMDLKNAVANSLVDILEPVRANFEREPELLLKMQQLRITR
jgi:tyrosyl-tRNA synthetase